MIADMTVAVALLYRCSQRATARVSVPNYRAQVGRTNITTEPAISNFPQRLPRYPALFDATAAAPIWNNT